MWWSERVQLQVLGGQLNIQNKTNPLLTPMGREMRGPLCVLAGVRRRPRTLKVPARSLPLAHSLTHSVHTISPPTLYPSLHWPLSRALVTPGHPSCPGLTSTRLSAALSPAPCSPLLLTSVHRALWTVTSTISYILNLFQDVPFTFWL